MRRRADVLIPIEVSILDAAVALWARGVTEFYGFLLAKEIGDRHGSRLLTAHGTLYKALDRMERQRWLVSRWEDPMVAAGAHRPRRRFYRVTPAGETALARAQTSEGPVLRKGLSAA